jgi:pimeloyl-ACP methyl ester carboxylesterase
MCPPFTWTENFFYTQGGYIRYFCTGGIKPSILLLHGGMDSGLCWTRVAKVLENDFSIVMPDIRDHGKSFSIQIESSLSDLVDDTSELIKHLYIFPAVVIGH